MDEEIKRIDIKEFRELGYLQEVNRLFLHPLGLALEIVQEEDGTERLGGVWDYRKDPEGMAFAEETMKSQDSLDKAFHVHAERISRIPAREKIGYPSGIQMVPGPTGGK